MRSQKRIRMSLRSKRRIGALNSRRLRQNFQRSATTAFSFGSSRNSRCTKIVAVESKIDIVNPKRTPGMTPKRSIKIPPTIGATMIGTRRMTIWMPIPIA